MSRVLSALLSNVKFKLMGDFCSAPEELMLSFLDPTWAATTSEAPWVLNCCPVQGVMARVEVFTTKIPMGRLRNRIKKTGTFPVHL